MDRTKKTSADLHVQLQLDSLRSVSKDEYASDVTTSVIFRIHHARHNADRNGDSAIATPIRT